jgi:excisionase family DNA binding protein
MQGTDRLMTMAEVSDLLGIPVSTLYGWRHRGEGPAGYRIGLHVRYRREAVEAWIETRADNRLVGSDMSGFVEKRTTGRWRARYRGPDGRERSKTFDRDLQEETLSRRRRILGDDHPHTLFRPTSSPWSCGTWANIGRPASSRTTPLPASAIVGSWVTSTSA